VKLTSVFKDFFESEKASGLVLLACTGFSLLLANSSWQESYFSILHHQLAGNTITHWINEGLMTIFFLFIGLELEREFYNGELSNKKNALLPLVGAIGGMLVPAMFYLLFNFGTALKSGAGIPMATDIAFALGVLSLIGNRVPASLKVFLAALAVIDDLGAIIVISIFYTASIAWLYLLGVLVIWALLFALNRLKVYNLMPYLFGGIAMWYFMLHSGVHASITGVILAFVIPFGTGTPDSTSYILQKTLLKPVTFLVLPIFALANTAIIIGAKPQQIFTENYSIGIMVGLILGKAIGIFSFCVVAVKLGICVLPKELKRIHIAGAGFLGGIGFTMSVFITMLAFNDEVIINNAKLVIIFSSFISGLIGYIILKLALKKSPRKGRINLKSLNQQS
jgi:Na+:H+ antiporter, NhaA family